MWTRHFPLYHDLQKMIRDGIIGEVRAVQVSFGSDLESVERVMNPDLSSGVLGDIGIYTVNFADIVFLGEKPTNISATGVFAESGVDLINSITFTYSGRRIAQMLCSGSKYSSCHYLHINYKQSECYRKYQLRAYKCFVSKDNFDIPAPDPMPIPITFLIVSLWIMIFNTLSLMSTSIFLCLCKICSVSSTSFLPGSGF